MEIKIKQLAMVSGGSFMETIKRHSKIAIGAGIGIGLLAIGGVILVVVLKKKKKAAMEVCREHIEDWETISHWYRDEKGEIMIWV